MENFRKAYITFSQNKQTKEQSSSEPSELFLTNPCLIWEWRLFVSAQVFITSCCFICLSVCCRFFVFPSECASKPEEATCSTMLQLNGPSRLIVPCSLPGLADIDWAERRRFLLWVCTLFGLGLYLFRFKSVCESVTSCPCAVGGGLGWYPLVVCWRKSTPLRLEFLKIVFQAVIDMREWHHVASPVRLGLWETSPTSNSYSLFNTGETETMFKFHLTRDFDLRGQWNVTEEISIC